MDDDDFGLTDLFISLTLDVKLTRFIGNMIIPSTLTMNVAIDRAPDATDHEVEVALTKWRYWMEHVVGKCIAFGRDNVEAMDILLDDNGVNRTSNLFLLAPEDPSDELLGSLFQAKFNALGDGKLLALSVEIASDNVHGLSFTLIGDHSTYMAQTSEEFIGAPSFWERPWWHRNDASSIDVIKPEDEDVPTPSWAYSLDFLDSKKNTKDHVISQRPGFKPTVIDGGKPTKPKG